MSSRDPMNFIDDIREACQKITTYCGNLSYEQFAADSRTVDAVLHNFLIIGEAARNLSQDMRNRYPKIEWTTVIAFRNVIAHEYFGIDHRIVWRIVTKNVPELLAWLETEKTN